MCYCGVENQCFKINGDFAGCLKMTPVAVETAAEQTFEFGPLHRSTRVAATSWGVGHLPVQRSELQPRQSQSDLESC